MGDTSEFDARYYPSLSMCTVWLSTALFDSFPQEFLIQVPDSDSDDGHDESESEQESGGSRGTKVPHRPPTMDEIDSVLGQFRRDAEVRH